MFVNSSWKPVLAAAAAFGILAGGQICSAQTCSHPDAQLGGVFLYPADRENITLTVINLTSYTLTSTPRSQTSYPVVVYGDSWSYPFQRLSDPITVAPFRTAIWKEGYAGLLNKPSFFGRIRFTLAAPASSEFPLGWTHAFEIDMTIQTPDGGYSDRVSWAVLAQSKVDHPINDVWCPENTFCGGVWATRYMNPIGAFLGWSFDMKNIMTLTSPELVVAFYSPGANSLVLVVRETNNDDYFGTRLEWVDNGGAAVPGACNDSVYTH
ncbi:MAG: hypothetical protein IT158_08685 [Bryobacterales bacterium]|nr:hypothetical protein [Bryobacterales bacterium]